MTDGQKKQGFTLVELLIVIVIIAILAIITLVSFNILGSRAKVTSVQTDASKLAKALELQQNETGAYPTSVDSTASSLTYMKFSANNTLTKYTTAGTSYRFCVSQTLNSAVSAFAVYDSANSGLVNSGAGAGPTSDCTPPLPEFVNGIKCPVITMGTPATHPSDPLKYRVSVIYNETTISRIDGIAGEYVYIDQGALRRYEFLKSSGVNWNAAALSVRGTNGLYRTDCTLTWSWPAE